MFKKNEIDVFLKELYGSMHDKYDVDMVYDYLIRTNVSYADKGVVLSNMHTEQFDPKTDFFSGWIKRFIFREGINVFCYEKMKDFCQFVNGDIYSDFSYKIYVPLDYEHIYDGVNRIFDFINMCGIIHNSKVRNTIKIDDVVIRVNNEADCKKIINFINRDKYIRDGLIKGNIFAFSDGGVNVTYDGATSFNHVVACTIADYLNEMYSNNVSMNKVNSRTYDDYLKLRSQDSDLYSRYNKNVLSKTSFTDDDALLIFNLIRMKIHNGSIDDYYTFMNRVREFNINKKKLNNSETIKKIIIEFMLSYGKDGYNYANSFLNGNFELLDKINNDKLCNDFNSCGINRDYIFDVIRNSNLNGKNNYDLVDRYIRSVILNYIIDNTYERVRADINVGKGEENKLDDVVGSTLDFYVNNKRDACITRNNGTRNLLKVFDNRDMINLFDDIGVKDIYEYIDRFYFHNDYRGKKR